MRRLLASGTLAVLAVFPLFGSTAGLESVTDTAPAATLVINGTAGMDTVTVSDGPGGTTTVSSPTFESVTFANKTDVLFDGLGGGDTVNFNNPAPATGLTSFRVQNVATVTQTGVLNYPLLGVSASGNVTLGQSNDVNNVELSAGGSILFIDNDGYTIGGVHPSLSGMTASGAITLVSFSTDGITVTEPVVSDGDITVRTSRLLIDPAGSLTAATGSVILEAVGITPNINLGSTTDATGELELSDAEIDRIVTPVLSLTTFTGVITVSQPVSFAGHLILRSPNRFSATGTGSLSAPTLTFEYTFGTPRTWTITPTTVQVTGGAPIPYSGVTTLNVNTSVPMPLWTGPGDDTFVVTPSATTTINVDGNAQTTASPGDVLDFDLTGVVAPVLTATLGPDGYSGSLTSANRAPVNFSDIETIVDAPVDVAVTKTDNATSVAAGTAVTYTITVTNSAPVPVVGVQVADTFPAALTGVTWTCAPSTGSACTGAGSGNLNQNVTLGANGSVTFTATGTLTPSATGTLTNTVDATTPAGYVETNPANNTATDTSAITASADLILTKSGPSGTTFAGGELTYTITLRNAGPSDAQTVSLTDTIPTNTTFVSLAPAPGYTCTTGPTVTCTRAVLPPSATADTFTLTVAVNRPTAPGTTITNTATVTSTTPDPSGGNNSATAPAITVAEVSIPTLSGWMLLALAAMLAVAALRMTL
jgi:uncharacterized repeat protein (TIGR01451 family)